MDLAYYKQYEPFFGSWYIDRVIGRGSYGTVFEIVRTDFGHTYRSAMKVITIPSSQSEYLSTLDNGMDEESVTHYYRSLVEELVNEFALMSRMKGHSNIVSYEDHVIVERKNEVGWDIFIRMELLTPLSSYTRENKLSKDKVVQLGIDMCRALELCRKHKIIHRDVKPENILVSADGDFKLGDFGVARTAEKTMSGMSKKGTYLYIAPEVYRAQPYGASVDIYSLGIVLYKLLNNNKPPFISADKTAIMPDDQENAFMRRIRGETMPPPALADRNLAGIILKACSFESADRYSSPEQMRSVLEQYRSNPEKVIVAYKSNGKEEAKTGFTATEPAEEIDPDMTTPIVYGTGEAENSIEDTQTLFGGVGKFHEPTEGIIPDNRGDKQQGVQNGKKPVASGNKKKPAPGKGESSSKKIFIFLGLSVVLIVLAVLAFSLFSHRGSEQTAAQSSNQTAAQPSDQSADQTDAQTGEETSDAVKNKTDTPATISQPVPESTQRIVVESYDTSYAYLTLYQWQNGEWISKFSTDAYVGRNGVGSDYGEGRMITPEGTFELGFYFGLQSAGSNLDFRRVTPDTAWVDDVNSEYYNMMVDKSMLSDGVSYEDSYTIFADHQSYNYCIFIEHNGDGLNKGTAEPGKGSVITICGYQQNIGATVGCIDISAGDMRSLLSYLDSAQNPVIVIS